MGSWKHALVACGAEVGNLCAAQMCLVFRGYALGPLLLRESGHRTEQEGKLKKQHRWDQQVCRSVSAQSLPLPFLPKTSVLICFASAGGW